MVRDGTCGVTADVLIKCWFWLVGLVGKKMVVTIQQYPGYKIASTLLTAPTARLIQGYL